MLDRLMHALIKKRIPSLAESITPTTVRLFENDSLDPSDPVERNVLWMRRTFIPDLKAKARAARSFAHDAPEIENDFSDIYR